MWMPLTSGSPNIPGNAPRDYWPGKRYVDWVGTDVYAKFSNHTLWTNLTPVLQPATGASRSRSASTAPWDNDFDGAFTRRLRPSGWRSATGACAQCSTSARRYASNEFNLQYYRGARRSLRRMLNDHRWASHAPGTQDKHEPPIDPPGGGGTGGGGLRP